MKTVDQILKIKAVVLYILNKMPEGLDYIHLFKTMYFAQQDHLVTYGLPLMEDTFVARKHGPVPSLTYKAFRCAEGRIEATTTELNDFVNSIAISKLDGPQIVKSNEACDLDELSKSNVRILDKWIGKCRNIDAFDLSDLSHDTAWLQAISQTEKTGEDTRMSQYSIAEAGGASEAMLEVIRERLNNRRALEWT
ncbi:MAG: SocA family protein [Bacteroidales bacterium]|nr:SocA family protein [Bacteroidales bacterium]